MSAAMNELFDIFDLEQVEDKVYRGRSPKSTIRRVFGGQVVGQAIIAAHRTVPADRFIHSLHSYFLLGGDPEAPILFEVECIRDGRSFSTRRVLARQHGRSIFSFEASFSTDAPGFDHQLPMPEGLPQPELLRSRTELLECPDIELPETVRRFWQRVRPIEIKPVNIDHYIKSDPLPPRQEVWLRPSGPVPDDRALQAAVLAYASDMTLLGTAMFPHGRRVLDESIAAASIDHSMWFHRPDRLDDWLLFCQESPSAHGGRGFIRGQFFTRDGRLVCSVTQEGLIRDRNA